MQPVDIVCVRESGTIELETMQLHIEDLIFRWTQAGARMGPSMKDSIERVTKDPELILYFYQKLRPKFY